MRVTTRTTRTSSCLRDRRQASQTTVTATMISLCRLGRRRAPNPSSRWARSGLPRTSLPRFDLASVPRFGQYTHHLNIPPLSQKASAGAI